MTQGSGAAHANAGSRAGTPFTLITGGSQGIGRAMAEECARRGLNLLLVALDTPDLIAAADHLRSRYQVRVHTLGIDLTADDAPRQVLAWCEDEGHAVNMLINNAGFGRNGVFDSMSLGELQAMMRLNNQALMEMTHTFLPMLRRHSQAYILNMSSMEGTLPVPFKSVYTGTKHFVYGFSLALREELKADGIKVSVLCPGPTLTNEDGLKRIQAQGPRARLLVMMPEDVAGPAITGLLAGVPVIVPGRLPKTLMLLGKILPTRTKMNILARVFHSYRNA